MRALRRCLPVAVTLLVSLASAATAQAVVVHDSGIEAGVALVPAMRSAGLPAGVSAATANGSCSDPWLTTDLGGPLLPRGALCYEGGSVIHRSETFALTWDASRSYWSGTRGYMEQFLRDVADASGSLGSPFALTQQYSDSGGRALNSSIFGGGCIDYGAVGGSACEFASANRTGHDYPASGCTPTGDSFTSVGAVGVNTVCLTDAQLQSELATMISQTGIVGRTQPGYTPLVSLLLPPGVEVCLDAGGNLCSANGSLTPPPPVLSTAQSGGSIADGSYQVEITYVTANGEGLPSSSVAIGTSGGGKSTITVQSPPPANGATGWYAYLAGPSGAAYTRQGSSPNPIGSPLTLASLSSGGPEPPTTTSTGICSYHSEVSVGGVAVPYVVQPWTPGTSCDEPGAPAVGASLTPQQLAVDAGARMVSPLSQSEIAAIVDPALNGWVAQDGAEIDDNGGCRPLTGTLDSVTVGTSSQNPYLLQREFNNAGLLESDPNTYFGCAPNVILSPSFVVPSSVNAGDEVQFDGSSTASTLIVPGADYLWSFGDGTSAVGPSVVHSYAHGGDYTVTLMVIDRGGNVAKLSQTIVVLGPGGQPAGTGSSAQGLRVRLLLIPQGLAPMLRHGLVLRVSSNQRASGIAYISISRALARRVGIRAGRRPSVVIGVGTISSLRPGTVSLRLRFSDAVAARLRRLGHLALTIRLALVGSSGRHVSVDVAGRY